MTRIRKLVLLLNRAWHGSKVHRSDHSSVAALCYGGLTPEYSFDRFSSRTTRRKEAKERWFGLPFVFQEIDLLRSTLSKLEDSEQNAKDSKSPLLMDTVAPHMHTLGECRRMLGLCFRYHRRASVTFREECEYIGSTLFMGVHAGDTKVRGGRGC
eukprot:6482616-Amphidinium_carterae.1